AVSVASVRGRSQNPHLTSRMRLASWLLPSNPRMKTDGRDGRGKRWEALRHGVSAVNRQQKNEGNMKKFFAAAMRVAVMIEIFPVATAAECPAEGAQAKDALAKKTGSARGQDVQAPRSLAGARSQDIQAPRGQDVQAPRGQDVQAPRGQDVQAPRGQDVQAPRGQDVQAPRGQDVQAPRGQDVQAPRGQDVQAPRGQDVQAP